MALNACSAKIELAIPTTYTDYSAVVSVVNPEAQSRMQSEAYIFSQDFADLVQGKLEPFNITLRGLYSTSTTDPCTLLETQHATACGGLCGLRVSLPTGATGDKVQTYASCPIVSYKPPDLDSASADPMYWEVVLRANDYTPSVVV